MKIMNSIIAISLTTIAMTQNTTATQNDSSRIFDLNNKQLARTVNFGNALEAPNEGVWGVRLEENYFELVKNVGFSAVRLPAKFSAHADTAAPFKLERSFMLRIDWAIQQAKKRNLAIIIDLHHYDELFTDPQAHVDRWLALWRQIATRYANQPDSVIFEPLNEPHEKIEPFWNEYFKRVLEVIRETNPTRAVIVGPNGWNNADRLGDLELPDDPNLIVTFHNYTPFEFTHQGAEWWADGSKYLGTKWTGTPEQRAVVANHIAKAVAYGKRTNRPVFMGEFGAYSKADLSSRVQWTTFTRQTAEAQGLSWGYWEFGAGFGVYDRLNDVWRAELLKALLPNAKP
jgi:endoglucanase